MKNRKPLGKKSYGHIPHLPGSRMGPADKTCHEGQARIATEKVRDKHDRVIVQEKLDGSNVGVALWNGEILPLTRAGYLANTSPYRQHHVFYDWVLKREKLFRSILQLDGERICGEWMLQAHGTKYDLQDLFIPFDIIFGTERLTLDKMIKRTRDKLPYPCVVSNGPALAIDEAMKRIGKYGFHGAIDQVEGAVWRVERNKKLNNNTWERFWVVDFLVKYVRPDKVDGLYMKDEIWNEGAEELLA